MRKLEKAQRDFWTCEYSLCAGSRRHCTEGFEGIQKRIEVRLRGIRRWKGEEKREGEGTAKRERGRRTTDRGERYVKQPVLCRQGGVRYKEGEQ